MCKEKRVLTEDERRIFNLKQWKNKIVRHFKGNIYLIEDISTNSETGEQFVKYRALYGDCISYIRPLSMFIEKCNEEQYAKHGQVFRFQEVILKDVTK